MRLRFLTAGESHGPELTAILEGMPAGMKVDHEALVRLLARRQGGFGTGGRSKIEADVPRITAGLLDGVTTGAPIAVGITNRDHANWSDVDIPPLTVPRPGHADLTATEKYGYPDLRYALERASARETAARVAVGGLCLQLLGHFGMRVGSYVVAIGDVAARLPPGDEYDQLFAAAEESDVRCPDPEAAAAMRLAIQEAVRRKDTLGGIFEVVALGVPPGLGSHVQGDRRLTGRLLGAAGTIPAVKGAEVGPAFANASRPGTEVHDTFHLAAGRVIRNTNRAGGLEGGITTGEAVVLRCAMKPLSSTLTPLASVDLASGEEAPAHYERSDFCAVPRAAVVGEAVVGLVLADALLEKLGGDSLAEMRPRFENLTRSEVASFNMANRPWRLDRRRGG